MVVFEDSELEGQVKKRLRLGKGLIRLKDALSPPGYNPTSDQARNRSVTGVDEAESTASWLGRDFVLQDEIWVDLAYRPGMPRKLYEGRADQPAELAAYAELGQNMLVVAQSLAYEIRAGEEASRPLLLQNAPNPFNASTAIAFQVPAALDGKGVRLGIYNLAGQLVRMLQPASQRAGEHRLTWDGRDGQGREVASGVYVYRLEVGAQTAHRRMLLLH